jgi:hypothetical protein
LSEESSRAIAALLVDHHRARGKDAAERLGAPRPRRR